MLQAKKDVETENNEENDDDMWIITPTEFYCKPCLNYSNHKSVPDNLKTTKRGTFGVFKVREVEARAKWTHKEQKKQRRMHKFTDLHKWCYKQYDKDLKSSEEEKDKNIKATELIVANVLYCLKQSESAKDFIRICDKQQLEMGELYPTKNDGAQVFYEIRNLAYEELGEISKKCLHFKNAAFSLDKVTIKSIPYTVLVTYYFHFGEIKVFLNMVHPMTSTEYTGEETAEMVGKILMATMGYTKREVASTYFHAGELSINKNGW